MKFSRITLKRHREGYWSATHDGHEIVVHKAKLPTARGHETYYEVRVDGQHIGNTQDGCGWSGLSHAAHLATKHLEKLGKPGINPRRVGTPPAAWAHQFIWEAAKGLPGSRKEAESLLNNAYASGMTAYEAGQIAHGRLVSYFTRGVPLSTEFEESQARSGLVRREGSPSGHPKGEKWLRDYWSVFEAHWGELERSKSRGNSDAPNQLVIDAWQSGRTGRKAAEIIRDGIFNHNTTLEIAMKIQGQKFGPEAARKAREREAAKVALAERRAKRKALLAENARLRAEARRQKTAKRLTSEDLEPFTIGHGGEGLKADAMRRASTLELNPSLYFNNPLSSWARRHRRA